MLGGMDDYERKVRQNLKDDFPKYAHKCLRIRPKDIREGLTPLRLNAAQILIHSAVEAQRKEKGYIRALILKARQQGSSTYVQGRFMWRISHSNGARGFILAHTEDSTANLFNMSKVYYENLPALVRPVRTKSNAKEMCFHQLNSSYKTETAGGRGAGRSETIQFLHLSEAAYFPNAEATIIGVTQAVPHLEGTEVFIESTSAGPNGLFYEMCNEAHRGGSEYQLIFIPWYVQEEYSMEAPADFAMDAEEAEHAAEFGLTSGQVYWRRMRIAEVRSLSAFRREYPATVEEAFRVSAPGALWTSDLITGTRVAVAPPLARVVVAIDPSGSDKATADAQGIVVVGMDFQGHSYVLEDATGKRTPEAWAKTAVELFDRYQADRIVAEVNYGGQMVEHVVRSVRPSIPFRAVTATRGKAIRAEPIAALYEKGVVHHVGMFPPLEDEMTTWSPLTSRKSPNRMDALVWALTDLMIGTPDTIVCREMEI